MRKKLVTGYRILSQKSPTTDEAVFEVETQLASSPAKKEMLHFRRFGVDWKVVIDENFVNSAR